MGRKVRKIWVAEYYPHNTHYVDEANQTIGQPLTSMTVLQNRRNVSKKLNAKGNKVLQRVIDHFEKKFKGIGDVKVEFSSYCGCSMCPCSPGFKVFVELYIAVSYEKMTENDRYFITNGFNDRPFLRCHQPRWTFALLQNFPHLKNKRGEHKMKFRSEYCLDYLKGKKLEEKAKELEVRKKEKIA
jgi:hypothetical protein